MCTGIVENTRVSGSGKGPHGWFLLDQASVSYDHPDHAQAERAVIIDLLSELTPQSARDLVRAILTSLSRGEDNRPGARNESLQ